MGKSNPPRRHKARGRLFLNELNLHKGQHILDIPCGYGRHAIEFAKRG